MEARTQTWTKEEAKALRKLGDSLRTQRAYLGADHPGLEPDKQRYLALARRLLGASGSAAATSQDPLAWLEHGEAAR